MEIFYESRPNLFKKAAIALGFFDGVHLGHQAVINSAIEHGKVNKITSAIVTFKDHPRALIRGNSPLLLTTIEQRLAIFEKMGVEAVLVLTFTEELCRLSPREYVESVLVECMGAKLISVGYNHHFGRQREGNPQLLAEFGKDLKYQVQIVNPVYLDGLEVSSSKIRECLENTSLDIANKLLSRPFSLIGQVIKGDGRGRKIGYPTANLKISPVQMLPTEGVYIAGVRIIDSLSNSIFHNALVNIGHRPTFGALSGISPLTEVHLLNFKDDLYHKNMELYFYKYLRPEIKFPDIDALKAQVANDCQLATKWFSKASFKEKV